MKDQPVFVSVIIPLYNKAGSIAGTVDSVLSQTHQDLELIIVNDGSTDAWEQALGDRMLQSRIRIIHLPHAGVSIARNTGLGEAKHSWVAFLDADDRWAPRFLERLIDLSRQYPDQRAFCSGRYHVHQGKERRYRNRAIPKEGEHHPVSYLQSLAWGNPAINCSNNLLHRSLFDSASFREGMNSYEDHDLWLRLFARDPIYMRNEGLSYYYKADANHRKREPDYPNNVGRYLRTILHTYIEVKVPKSRKWLRHFMTKWALSESNKEAYAILERDGRQLFLLPTFMIRIWRRLKVHHE